MYRNNLLKILLTIFLSFSLAENTEASNKVVEKSHVSYIYLTRHAEKQHDGTHNPSLTEMGQSRAENIKELLKDKNIAQVYSTNYKRTMETSEPLAKELKLTIKNYDPRDLQAFAKQLLKLKENVLVVGHSNTTPSLARLLGGENIPDLKETEYEHVFLIKITNVNQVKVETVFIKSKPY
jgi:2,3-bisphosphoglycerate-dependent phosphoglycerate mutase